MSTKVYRNARGKKLEKGNFPHMSQLIRENIKVCEIWLNNKYDTLRDQKYNSHGYIPYSKRKVHKCQTIFKIYEIVSH